MGLGIAIAAELARSMEGRMWVESELGKGSTFYFRVRLELSSRNAAHKAPDASALVGVRILIFDNRAINRHTLSHAVVDWGMRPFPVSTGGAVLSGLKEAAAAGDPFPLVLMDSEMSDMDSFALSEQIRDNTHCNAPAILILASAGLRGDAARCRGLGIAAYLTTPIRRSQLRDALVTALESRTLEGRKPPLITRHTLREDQPLRILVAEDNPVNQILLVRFLAQYGHTVTTVNDGEQAVAELEKKPVDVILMDLQMPKLDGFAATAKIRQREDASGQHTPIIAVTANVVPGEMQHCKEIGMDGYIAKPLCVPELLHTIGRLANSMKSPAPQDAVTASLAQHDEEAVSVFLSDTPGKIAELRRAWEQSDFEAVRGLAHYLKGSAQYLGERRMNHLCDEVRACSTAGKAGEMGELLVGVEEEFARIEEGALWRKGANSWEE
jgi:CheY-like chemotaxis protein